MRRSDGRAVGVDVVREEVVPLGGVGEERCAVVRESDAAGEVVSHVGGGVVLLLSRGDRAEDEREPGTSGDVDRLGAESLRQSPQTLDEVVVGRTVHVDLPRPEGGVQLGAVLVHLCQQAVTSRIISVRGAFGVEDHGIFPFSFHMGK
jgi:hypothetical protein